MRRSEFSRLVTEEFGPGRGPVMVDTLNLPGLDCTGAEALARGVDPREVWQALCELQEVPQERRLGRDVPPKP